MSPNKIIIMGIPAQPPLGGPPQDFGPPGPISTAEVRILYLLVHIQHGLGRMEEAIEGLKTATNSHRTDLDGLGERHNKDLSELKKDVNELGRKLENDVNQLGRRLENKINDVATGISKEVGELKTNDIGGLKSFRDTAKTLGGIILFVFGPVATAIFIAIAVHTYRIIDRLLTLANSH